MSAISTPTDQDHNRYEASAFPSNSSSHEINISRRCYLPVSLETKPFERPMLDAVVDWISENFNNCAVLVCDRIHRLTLQITRNLSREEALSEALRLGEVFIEKNEPLFQAKLAGRFKFLTCSNVMKYPKYAGYRDALSEMFYGDNKDNRDFQSSINQCAASYVDRRFKNKGSSAYSMTRPEMMELSHQYLIEEMGLFATVIEMGWTVDVYPGEDLKTFVEIAKGKYPNAPEPLIKRKSVELKLKTTPESKLISLPTWH